MYLFPYTLNRVAEWEGQCFVQVHCGAPWLADGGLSDGVPWTLSANSSSTSTSATSSTSSSSSSPPNPFAHETREDGFFWIGIHDFWQYFDTVHEVRLVNSGVKGRIRNMHWPGLYGKTKTKTKP